MILVVFNCHKGKENNIKKHIFMTFGFKSVLEYTKAWLNICISYVVYK